MNRYLYAEADPTTLVDPDGHCAAVLAFAGPWGAAAAVITCLDVAAGVVLGLFAAGDGVLVGKVIVQASDNLRSESRADPTQVQGRWKPANPFDWNRDDWRTPFTKNPDAPEPGDRPPFRFCASTTCKAVLGGTAGVATVMGCWELPCAPIFGNDNDQSTSTCQPSCIYGPPTQKVTYGPYVPKVTYGPSNHAYVSGPVAPRSGASPSTIISTAYYVPPTLIAPDVGPILRIGSSRYVL